MIEKPVFTPYLTKTYKGIAILCVILCHLAGVYGKGEFVLFTPLGGVGVSIFLFLSAYGLNESWRSALGKAYWRKRFIAVWVPYIIVQLISYWPFHKFEIIPFILDLTLIKPLYHNGWYLQYAFLWYAIFYCIRRVKVLDRHRVALLGIVSLVLFFTLREIMVEQSLSFLFGIILSERRGLQEKISRIKIGLLFLAFGVLCLAVKQLPIVRNAPQIMMNLVQLGIKLPIGFGIVVLCYYIVKKMRYLGNLLNAIGTVSYELYLIHGYILLIVPISIVGIVLFLFVTALLSFVYWYVLKKLQPVLYKVLRI